MRAIWLILVISFSSLSAQYSYEGYIEERIEFFSMEQIQELGIQLIENQFSDYSYHFQDGRLSSISELGDTINEFFYVDGLLHQEVHLREGEILWTNVYDYNSLGMPTTISSRGIVGKFEYNDKHQITRYPITIDHKSDLSALSDFGRSYVECNLYYDENQNLTSRQLLRECKDGSLNQSNGFYEFWDHHYIDSKLEILIDNTPIERFIRNLRGEEADLAIFQLADNYYLFLGLEDLGSRGRFHQNHRLNEDEYSILIEEHRQQENYYWVSPDYAAPRLPEETQRFIIHIDSIEPVEVSTFTYNEIESAYEFTYSPPFKNLIHKLDDGRAFLHTESYYVQNGGCVCPGSEDLDLTFYEITDSVMNEVASISQKDCFENNGMSLKWFGEEIDIAWFVYYSFSVDSSGYLILNGVQYTDEEKVITGNSTPGTLRVPFQKITRQELLDLNQITPKQDSIYIQFFEENSRY